MLLYLLILSIIFILWAYAALRAIKATCTEPTEHFPLRQMVTCISCGNKECGSLQLREFQKGDYVQKPVVCPSCKKAAKIGRIYYIPPELKEPRKNKQSSKWI